MITLRPECPVCRRSLGWALWWRPIGARWRCARCDSLLAIDWGRRVFVALALPAAFVVSTFVLARLGLGSTLLRLLAVIAVVPALLAIDRARVLERRGLHCRGCGYDLRGQVAPRCPECSRELDEAEQAAVQRGTVAASADREPRRAWPWLVVAVVLLIGTIVLVGYTHWRGGPRGSAATNPVPATAPAVPSGC